MTSCFKIYIKHKYPKEAAALSKSSICSDKQVWRVEAGKRGWRRRFLPPALSSHVVTFKRDPNPEMGSKQCGVTGKKVNVILQKCRHRVSNKIDVF